MNFILTMFPNSKSSAFVSILQMNLISDTRTI